MKVKTILTLLVFILAVATYRAQEKKAPAENKSSEPAAQAAQVPPNPHSFNISPEDAARKNPLRFSEISVERGKKLFQTQCAMCHGEKGDGKGELVEELKIHPPDFTNPETLEKRTNGELFAIIETGSAAMPGQGKRMKEFHKWEMINYLRALSGKTPLKSTQEELMQGTAVVHDDK
jgi:mono/diheme cytochrome c family protein